MNWRGELISITHRQGSALDSEPTEAPIELPGLVRVTRGGRLPVSIGQERRLRRFGFTRPFNPVTTVSFQCHGQLDQDAFELAMRELVNRHEALRSVFGVDGPECFQLVHDLPADLRLTHVLPVDGDSGIHRAPFDLRRGPFLRSFIRFDGPDRFRLELDVDHFVADGISLQLLLGELTAAYAALVSGERHQLPRVDFHAADYAAWQRALFAGPARAAIAERWARILAAPPMNGPDRSAPELRQAPTGSAGLSTTVPPEFARRLTTAGPALATTHFMVAAAGFAQALAVATGSGDVAFVTSASGRHLREHFRIVANLVKTVPVRIRCDPLATPDIWLAATQQAVRASIALQDLQLIDVAEDLQARARPHIPLTDLPYFATQGPPQLRLPGVVATPATGGGGEALWRHSTFLSYGDPVTASIVFDRGRVSSESAQDLLDSFVERLDATSRLAGA